MVLDLIAVTVFLLSAGALAAPLLARRTAHARSRLLRLTDAREEATQAEGSYTTPNWGSVVPELESLTSRLGRAGFVSQREQRIAKLCGGMLALVLVMASTAVGRQLGAGIGAAIGTVVGCYLSGISWLMFLRNRKHNHEREVAFLMPLTLESLILLVESGLGILPAIQRLVAGSKQTKVRNPVVRYLRLVYELAAHGTPLGTALAHVADATELRVLRHVLLHLDISGTEGGELVPSLRNLSNHAHTDWRLSVENRVRRLENLVVFPVFVSVIGLMCLTAAVPLVPVLKLKESLQRQSVVPGGPAQAGTKPLVIK